MQLRLLCIFVLYDKKTHKIFGMETIYFVILMCYNT